MHAHMCNEHVYQYTHVHIYKHTQRVKEAAISPPLAWGAMSWGMGKPASYWHKAQEGAACARCRHGDARAILEMGLPSIPGCRWPAAPPSPKWHAPRWIGFAVWKVPGFTCLI